MTQSESTHTLIVDKINTKMKSVIGDFRNISIKKKKKHLEEIFLKGMDAKKNNCYEEAFEKLYTFLEYVNCLNDQEITRSHSEMINVAFKVLEVLKMKLKEQDSQNLQQNKITKIQRERKISEKNCTVENIEPIDLHKAIKNDENIVILEVSNSFDVDFDLKSEINYPLMNFKNVVVIDAAIIKAGMTIMDIKANNNKEEQVIMRNLNSFKYIVIVDYDFPNDILCFDRIEKLKKAFITFAYQIKVNVKILNGGYKKWVSRYPAETNRVDLTEHMVPKGSYVKTCQSFPSRVSKMQHKVVINSQIDGVTFNNVYPKIQPSVTKVEYKEQIVPTFSRDNKPKLQLDMIQANGVDGELSSVQKVVPTNNLKSMSTSSPDLTNIKTDVSKRYTNVSHINASAVERSKSKVALPTAKCINGIGAHCTNKYKGIDNLGNSCYMNSVIQSLFFVKMFVRGVEMVEFDREINGAYITKTIHGLFKELNKEKATNSSITAQAIIFKNLFSKKFTNFEGFQQQDSHEFLTNLLDSIHSEIKKCVSNDVNKKTPDISKLNLSEASKVLMKHSLDQEFSFITKFVMGQIASTIKCEFCNQKSFSISNFHVLTLPAVKTNKPDLQDCMDAFLESEHLSKEECGWVCSKCNIKRDATKHISIPQLPTLLIIHLNRFEFSLIKKLTIKLGHYIDFPLNDFEPLKSTNYNNYQKYTLIAVVNHFGTLNTGHYTSFCQSNNYWYSLNDDEIYDFNGDNKIQSSAAYILFYLKNST
ncbi:hypothetical protein A3Q56_02031 [Intoshia linei]|uniref:Ubiquitin carboxyl-terminal hydrolase n=1 Tax=Intoshia linei TaxID=1819745 RepID=A0A177B974_9BILA|nr:hypothetical protein A3Q56_02031 [Intoshia linei]